MHTDVPEFRGANRKLIPQWLLVVMQHSGLFDGVPHADRDRHCIAVRYWDGGELAYWPDGPDGPVAVTEHARTPR